MIVYFTDRRLNVLGLASSEIATGFAITDDKKTESIENGVVTFDVTIAYEQETKETLESYCEAGNYLFRSTGGEAEFYTIIDEETDSSDQTITLYCEDAGMDLLNGVAGTFKADAAHPIAWYFNQWIKGTGFEIGVNEIASLSRKLEWDGESTITERLASVATQFDNAEVSYSFEIDRLKVSKMYVNIFKKRGANKAVKLRMGREISNIKIKKSVADIATALKCTGGTPEGKEAPITLNGYKFDDGDFYVDGDKLCCRSALIRWGRLGTNQHIVKTYSYDTSSQSELCAHAVTKLKSIKDTAFTMSADIIRLPDGVGVGDRVIIVDDEGKTYVSTRLLTLEKSVLTGSVAATLGDYIQQDAGISAQVQELAEKFAAIATSKADALAAAKAAEEARKKAEAAKSAADNATNTANAAKNTADAANSTADTAKSTADAASTTAGQAKATADGAKNTADTAKSTADTAKSTADTAKSTADTAKSTADAAKSTAETNATDLTNYVTSNNSTLEVMQSLIDGSIMTWFFPCPPADANEPTSKWTSTDLKNQHLGDLYYDTDTGYCYRYQVEHQIYSWRRITDVDVTKALADAKNAQDTADGKRRVFTVQPTPPYDVGDLWAAGANGDIKRCRIAKTSEQSYAASDWELASKYTDDTTANAAKSTADNANSKIDDLKVGGRNLLVGGSGPEQTFSYPSSGSIEAVKWVGVALPPETDFMLSFDAKASDDGNKMYSYFWNPSNLTRVESSQGTVNHNAGGYMEITLTTEWKRYWIHYTGPITASRDVLPLKLFAGYGTGTVSIRKIKLELGNKATDWTPAPEDVEATTDQLRDDLNSTESALNTQINEASKKTDSTNSALNEARDELSKRIADAMAQAQTAAAAAKVAQTDLDNYKSMTVDPQLKTMSDFMAKYNLSFRQDSTGLYITNQNADGTTADISLRLGNDRISFIQGTGDAAYEVAFISNNQLYITSGEFLKGLRLGNYALIPGANGNLSCKKVK
ncbi:phage tail spike protein [Baileyella intestinalis]|uniref:phage tail spike protein n=1 Tax=Baileyella intestinalis TaxID=2606709 RepID=UPI003A8A756B